jgi:hypothetical protein
MRRRTAWLIAVPTGLLGIAIGAFFLAHPLEEMSPTLSPEKRQLFKFVRNCQPTESWQLDFAGTRDPYTIERRRCTPEQISKAFWVRGLRLHVLEFVLVEQHKLFRSTVVAGWDCDGECPEVRQLQFSGKPVLLLTTVPAGSGGYDDWCILGWMGDYIGCWHLPDEITRGQRLVEPDEMMHALHPRVEGGKLVFSAPVGGPNDSNCCPTHGEVHIVLAPGDGDFMVERIYRTPPAAHSQ